ncbi:MAG: flagellin [Nibricoccus sp.]
MSVVINSNYAATVAANNLAASNTNLQKSLNRLSSGSKIVSPSDDAGGLAVSMKLSAAAKRQGAINNNISNAIAFLQTQDGAMKVASKVLERMSELATLYTDVTKSTSDLANYNTEFTALDAQISLINSEQFNGRSLFGTALSVSVNDSSGTVTLSSKSTVANQTIGNAANIITALQTLATNRAANGAEQSQLTFAAELVTTNKANIEAANSRIIDVDVAEESTQLARWNTLVQAGTSMLTQANQSAQTALKLLQ